MKVLKSWGAEGRVMLSSSSEDPRDLKDQEPVFIEFDGLPVPFFFESVEPKGGRFIVKFEGVDSLEEAEELVGREVCFEEEEYGDDESLEGLTVVDAKTRRTVGTVVDSTDYSGNMVITVESPDGGEILLPIHEDLIVSIHDDTLVMDIPDGLI
ncbi:MAG: ribosome maturation factor RimM [Bacteroidales bacterium]|nr:ribosome maturation factor RimM [Bacteroidales bacterium]